MAKQENKQTKKKTTKKAPELLKDEEKAVIVHSHLKGRFGVIGG